LPPDAFARLKVMPKMRLWQGSAPDPLGKLTAFPRPHSWIWGLLCRRDGRGERGWEKKGGKERGEKGEGRQGRGPRGPESCVFPVTFLLPQSTLDHTENLSGHFKWIITVHVNK